MALTLMKKIRYEVRQGALIAVLWRSLFFIGGWRENLHSAEFVQDINSEPAGAYANRLSERPLCRDPMGCWPGEQSPASPRFVEWALPAPSPDRGDPIPAAVPGKLPTTMPGFRSG